MSRGRLLLVAIAGEASGFDRPPAAVTCMGLAMDGSGGSSVAAEKVRSGLRVLVVSTESWAAEQAERDLRGAGHEVLRCHDHRGSAFPCNWFLAGTGSCPVDLGIDVCVTVRLHPLPRPTAHEFGVICSLRAGVPVAVAGNTILNPFAEHVASVGASHDVVGLCERTVVSAAERTASCVAVSTRPNPAATRVANDRREVVGRGSPRPPISTARVESVSTNSP